MKVRARLALFTVGVSILVASAARAAPTSSVEGWYTPDQASAGRTRYAANCAACHGSNLQGGAGPALSGSSFAAKWRNHPLSDLYTVAHDQMPLTAPGSLPVNTSWQIIAYILSFNGFQAGATPLSAAELNRAITPPQSGKSAMTTLAGAPKPPVVPVTQPSTHLVSQAELDAADTEPTNWLTYNKGYKGFRYSALDQINVADAPRLRAVCVMQSEEVGTCRTGPVILRRRDIVRDGVARRRSALDAAACGERRWELLLHAVLGARSAGEQQGRGHRRRPTHPRHHRRQPLRARPSPPAKLYKWPAQDPRNRDQRASSPSPRR